MYPFNAARPSHGQLPSIPAPPPSASSSSSHDASKSLNQLVASAVVSPNPERTKNAISRLQNVARMRKVAVPEFSVQRKGGEDHDPVFEAVCTWNSTLRETVQAGSKNEAKRRAAYNMLMRLQSMNINIEFETKSKKKKSQAASAAAFPSTPNVNSSSFFIDRGTALPQETKSPIPQAYSNANVEATPVVHTPYVPPIKRENFGYMNRTDVPFPPPRPMYNTYPSLRMHQGNSRQLQRHDVSPHAHAELHHRNQVHPSYYHSDGPPSRTRPHEIGTGNNGGSTNNHRFPHYSLGYANVRYPMNDGRRGAHRRKSSSDSPFEYSSSDRNRYRPNTSVPNGNENTGEKPRVAPRPSFTFAMGGTANKPNLSGELSPILRRDLNGNVSDPRLKLKQQKPRSSGDNDFSVKKEVTLNSTHLCELTVEGSEKIDDSAEEALSRQEELTGKVVTKNPARRLSVQREMLKGLDRNGKGVVSRRAITGNKLDDSEMEKEEIDGIQPVDSSKNIDTPNGTDKKMDMAKEDSPEKLKPSAEKKVELDDLRSRQHVVGRNTKMPLSEKKKLMDVDSQSQEFAKSKGEMPLEESKLPTGSDGMDTGISRSKKARPKTAKTIQKEITSKDEENECKTSEATEITDKSVKIEKSNSAAQKAVVILQNRSGNERPNEKAKKVSLVNEENVRNSRQLPIPPQRRSARERITNDSVVKTENVTSKKRTTPEQPKSSLGRYTPRRKTRSMTRAEKLAADASSSPEKKVETPSPMDFGPTNPKEKVEMPSPKKSVRFNSPEKKVVTSSSKNNADSGSTETISDEKRVTSSSLQTKVGTLSSTNRAASSNPENKAETQSVVRSDSPNSGKKVQIPSPTKQTKLKKGDMKLERSPSDVKLTQKRVKAKESKRRMISSRCDEKNGVDADLSKDKAGPIIARPTVHKFLLAAAPVTTENDGGIGDTKESIDSKTVALPVIHNGQESNDKKVNGQVRLKKPNAIGIEVSIDTETREVQMGSMKGHGERDLSNANGSVLSSSSRKAGIRSTISPAESQDSADTRSKSTITRLDHRNVASETETLIEAGICTRPRNQKRSILQITPNDELATGVKQLATSNMRGVNVRGRRVEDKPAVSSAAHPNLVVPAKKRSRLSLVKPQQTVIWMYCNVAEESVYELVRLVTFLNLEHVELSLHFVSRDGLVRPKPLVNPGERLKVVHDWDYPNEETAMLSLGLKAASQVQALSEKRKQSVSCSNGLNDTDFSLARVVLVTAQKRVCETEGIEVVKPSEIDKYVREVEKAFVGKHNGVRR